MRIALALVLMLSAPVLAEPRAKSTTLTLGRNKTKPVRLLVKKIEIDVLRSLTPCSLRIVVEPQHILFKRFSIEVGYQVDASGAIKNARGPISAEVTAVGTSNAIETKRGHADITRRKAHDFDVKLDTTFDHGSSQWTLAGTMRIEDAACLWDVEAN
ncbi:MAG TPA: hypothetical protein VIV40_12910 [Kofleriaceae bacterium]